MTDTLVFTADQVVAAFCAGLVIGGVVVFREGLRRSQVESRKKKG